MKIKTIYRPDTPFVARSVVYHFLILLALALDTATLYPLFNAVLNGSSWVAFTSTAAVAIVMDVYSVLLPNAVSHMEKRKQYKYFGIGLAVMIGIVFAVFLIFRLSTGDASTSVEVYELTKSSSVILNLLLGIVPLVSTTFAFYISLIKSNSDYNNIIYTIDTMIIHLQTQLNELKSSDDEIIRLKDNQENDYRAIIEKMKAMGQLMKIIARLDFAKSIGDHEAISKLSSEKIIAEKIIEAIGSDTLYPNSEDNTNINIKRIA